MIPSKSFGNNSVFMRNPFLKIIGIKRFNLRESLAQIRKPPYSPCPDKIILDITYACNLKCVKCNRSCRYAPADVFMTPSQIERFIRESVNQNRKWRQIWIEGGEPTLHPELNSILDLIMDYKKKHNPFLKVQLNSNGFGDDTVRKLKHIGERIKIFNSEKASPDVKNFCAFNLAPCDFDIYQNIDFSIGCYFPSFYGLSLNMNGYYHCSNAGGIDRVLGLDIGKRMLPARGDIWWKNQMSELCRYCGHFQINNRHHLSAEPPQVDYLISASWRKIYEEYHSHKESLTRY